MTKEQTAKLKELNDKKDKLLEESMIARKKAWKVESEINDINIVIVTEYLKENKPVSDETGEILTIDDIHFGDWDCKTSPIGVCLQDENDQEYTCVCCGGPEERK